MKIPISPPSWPPTLPGMKDVTALETVERDSII